MKKIFLIIFLVVLAAGLTALGIWYFKGVEFPVWLTVYILSGVVAVLLFTWLIVFFWRKKKEKEFISEILVEDESSLDKKEKQYVRELKTRWKQAIRDLKSSHLRTVGNPLYVLPWYMIIGESGTGKTTAIKNSRMSANFGEPNRLSGFSGTKNCDWWFFEKAIILDTAGRYAIHESEKRDKGEWHAFLQHLAKYRKKEPVNGLIVTISADKLLTADKKLIEEDGKKIRNRLEELMFFLGAKCPVHIMVTKCDLIHGMNSFCSSLPDETLSQAFGYLNEDMQSDVNSFMDVAFENITNQLKNIRLKISYKPGQKRIMPDVLLFPEEFEALKPGLDVFFENAFKDNLYQETVLIRGVYFTSAIQEGMPISAYTDSLENQENNAGPEVTEKSFFVHDFFAKILPEDRYLFEPTQNTLDSRKKISKVAVMCWFLAALTIGGFVSHSFLKNLNIIKSAQALVRNIEMTEDRTLYKDLSAVEDLKQTILDIEKNNEKWQAPRFGMHHSLEVERDLKLKYCSLFNEEYLSTYDKRLADRVLKIDKSTVKKEISQTIPVLVRRINLITKRLETPDLVTLSEMPKPDYLSFLALDDEYIIPKAVRMYEDHYHHYLMWQSDDNLRKSSKQLKMLLNGFVEKEEISLKWLAYWCERSSEQERITLKDFWKGSGTVKEKIEIPAAFTTIGMETISSFIDELSNATSQKLDIEEKKIDYDHWYKSSYVLSWHEFAKSFSKGINLLATSEEKLATAMEIATSEGPYFVFIQMMAEELAPFADYDGGPSKAFVPALYECVDIMTTAQNIASEKDGKGGGARKVKRLSTMLARKTKAGRVGMRVKRVASSSGGRTAGGKGSDGAGGQEKLEAAAIAFNTYKTSLAQMAASTLSPQAAYSFTSTAYGQDPATGKSPVYSSLNSLKRVSLAVSGYRTSEKVMADLLKGPERFLWQYLCRQTNCYLQNRWEEDVLSEVQDVWNKDKKEKLLWDEEEGYAKKFIKEVTSPFIRKSRKWGYYAKEIDGQKLKLTSSFFNFYKRRNTARKVVLEKYDVWVKGMPTESNPSARIIPHMTWLELEGEGGSQSMKNYNYPIKRQFIWKPGQSRDVNLHINVGDLELKKTYKGYYGFAKFLKDFKKGYKNFYRDDFPEYSNALKRVGVEYIKVKYKLSGSKPIISLMGLGSGKTPTVIASCSE